MSAECPLMSAPDTPLPATTGREPAAFPHFCLAQAIQTFFERTQTDTLQAT
jgi:hypothetical protein